MIWIILAGLGGIVVGAVLAFVALALARPMPPW